jgi:hypothetical protein
MDTSGWHFLYKIDYQCRANVTTNMLYTPLISPEGDIMCMLWDPNHPYQVENTKLTNELVQFCFDREVKHLKLMQGYNWAPKILGIDENKIYIEFGKETLNHILFTPGRDLNKECPDWKEQIFKIIKDIHDAGYYKVALYPHCFFLKDGVIKTIDFYSCVGVEERYIDRRNIEGMIGNQSTDRFNLSTTDDRVDFKKFFEITMTQFLSNTWVDDNPFPKFYKMLYENSNS